MNWRLTSRQRVELNDILCDNEVLGTANARDHQRRIANSFNSVRTITADFGFSFALPAIAVPPPVPIQIPVEPPAKRRKTNESISPKRCAKHTVADAKPHSPAEKQKAKPAESHPVAGGVLEESEPSRAQSTATSNPSKKPTRARRKLQLDEELEDEPQKRKRVASQNASVEDTFIFGLKPTKRRPKREEERALLEENGTDQVSEQASTALAKRRRTNKTKQEAVNEPAPRTEAPTTSGDTVAPRKAAKSKPASKQALKFVAVTNTEEASQSNSADATSTEPLLDNIAEAKEVAKPRKTVKAKSAATEKRPVEAVESDVQRDIATGPVTCCQ